MNPSRNNKHMKKLGILAILSLFLLAGAAAQNTDAETRYSSEYKLFAQNDYPDDFASRGAYTVVADGLDARIYKEEVQQANIPSAPALGETTDSIDFTNRWVVYDRPSTSNGATVGLTALVPTEDGARAETVYNVPTGQENAYVTAEGDWFVYSSESSSNNTVYTYFVPHNDIDLDEGLPVGESFSMSNRSYVDGVDPLKSSGGEWAISTEKHDGTLDKVISTSGRNPTTTDEISVSAVDGMEGWDFNNEYFAVSTGSEVRIYDRTQDNNLIKTFDSQQGEDFGKVALNGNTVVVYTTEHLAAYEISTSTRTNLFSVPDLGKLSSQTDSRIIYTIGGVTQGNNVYVDEKQGAAQDGTIAAAVSFVLGEGFGVGEDQQGVGAAFLLMVVSTAFLGRYAGSTGAGVGFIGATGLSAITGLIPGWIAFVLGVLAAGVIASFGGGSVSGRGGQ